MAAQLGLLPEHVTLRREMPTGWWRRGLGGLVGLLSAMMGIGGGSLGGMVMTLCGRPGLLMGQPPGDDERRHRRHGHHDR